MRRRILPILIGLTAGAGAATAPVAPAATPPPRASLTHFVCRQAQNPRHRDMSVTAVMRPVTATQHMAIKFILGRQLAGNQAFQPVRGTGLETWISPQDPTLGQRPEDVWKLAKIVKGLVGPAVYQFRVEFRWTDPHDHVLSHAHRTTSICRAD